LYVQVSTTVTTRLWHASENKMLLLDKLSKILQFTDNIKRMMIIIYQLIWTNCEQNNFSSILNLVYK